MSPQSHAESCPLPHTLLLANLHAARRGSAAGASGTGEGLLQPCPKRESEGACELGGSALERERPTAGAAQTRDRRPRAVEETEAHAGGGSPYPPLGSRQSWRTGMAVYAGGAAPLLGGTREQGPRHPASAQPLRFPCGGGLALIERGLANAGGNGPSAAQVRRQH